MFMPLRAAFHSIARAAGMASRDCAFELPATNGLLNATGTATKKALPATFNVLVWNVAKGAHPGLAGDVSRLSAKADLTLLQEAVDGKTSVLEATGERMGWQMARSFRVDPTADAFTGVATGSTAAAQTARGVATVAREPLSRTPKTTLATTYRIDGQRDPLLVVNVHAINFVPQRAFDLHLAEIKRLMRHHQGPALLAGDFNTWSPARRAALQKAATALQVTEALPSNDSRWLVLDHAFVRGLKVKSTQVLSSVKTSDHAPMVLQLSAS